MPGAAVLADAEAADRLSATTINASRCGGEVQISSDFTTAEATGLVTIMDFGSLPLEIREISFGACQASSPPRPSC